MKKYLGFIYLVYAGIIIYTLLSKIISNFLSPQLQIYTKIAIIPLIIIGIIISGNRKFHYHFKISDLILLIPIIMIILAQDGNLSLELAENRSSNLLSENAPKEIIIEEKKEDINITESQESLQESQIEVKKPEYDFTHPDFEVIDANYEGLANYLTFSDNTSFIGKTIKVRGFSVKYATYLPKGFFAIGKYIISCCVADASFGGFYVNYDIEKIMHNHWYEIEGVLEQGFDNDGRSIMYIRVVNINEIDSKDESQYVYPCYAYDNGECAAVQKYNLDYSFSN